MFEIVIHYSLFKIRRANENEIEIIQCDVMIRQLLQNSQMNGSQVYTRPVSSDDHSAHFQIEAQLFFKNISSYRIKVARIWQNEVSI